MMIKKFKNWVKDRWAKWKKWIIALLIPVALASVGTPIIDNQINPYVKIGEQYETYLALDSRVKIGGDDPDEFKPELYLGKWSDECWIKVSYPTDKKIKPKRDLFGNKIKWQDTDKEIHFYPLEPREFEENGRIIKQLEQGGFEFEVILKKKPLTNEIVLNIESQGLKFYYQPELTQEEKDEGAFRPENVVGSYAVYHATKRDHILGQTNYMVGKAFHIYRPKLIDSNGWEVWGDLKIDEGKETLIVTIPQDFMDNAVYPIRHVAGLTFGYTSEGASDSAFDGTFGRKYIKLTRDAPADGNGDGVSITAWVEGVATAKNAKCNIYDDGDGEEDLITNLIANGATEEKEIPINHDDELTFDFSSSPSLTDGVYYRLAIWAEGGSLNWDATAMKSYNVQLTYGTWPDPLTMAAALSDATYSIYCTYTAAAAERRIIIIE